MACKVTHPLSLRVTGSRLWILDFSVLDFRLLSSRILLSLYINREPRRPRGQMRHVARETSSKERNWLLARLNGLDGLCVQMRTRACLICMSVRVCVFVRV